MGGTHSGQHSSLAFCLSALGAKDAAGLKGDFLNTQGFSESGFRKRHLWNLQPQAFPAHLKKPFYAGWHPNRQGMLIYPENKTLQRGHGQVHLLVN